MRLAVDDMEPFAGHFADAVHIDWFEKLCFDKRQTGRPPIRLPGSGVNHMRRSILLPARFENREWGKRIHMQIGKRIFHRFDVTDMASKIEDILLIANEPAHQQEVSRVTFDDLDILANGFNIEVIGAAGGIQRIDDADRGPDLDQTYCQVAADEAQAARD